MKEEETTRTGSHRPGKLARNTVFSAIAEGSSILLFVLFIFAARYLGDEQFGIFMFALAFVGIFGVVNDCGLRYVYVREVSRDESLAEEYLGNILILQVCLSTAGILLIAGAVNLLGKPSEVRDVVFILAFAEVIRSLKFTLRFVFRTFQRFELEAISLLIERLSLLGVGIAVLTSGSGVIWFAACYLGVRIIDLIVTLVFVRSVVRIRILYAISLWPKLLKNGIPFVLTGIVLLLLVKVDSVMLSMFRTDSEVGWYNAGYKLIEGLMIIPLILANALFPAMSRIADANDELQALYARSTKIVLAAALPLAIVGIVLAEKAIQLLFGTEYLNAVILLQVLLCSIIFSFTYQIGGVLLAAIGKQIVVFYSSIVALALNIALNFILIPRLGGVGAAITTVVSAGTLFAIIVVYLHGFGIRAAYIRLALLPMAASLAVAYLVSVFSVSLLVAIFAAPVAYFGLLLLFSYWDGEELDAVRGVLGVRKR